MSPDTPDVTPPNAPSDAAEAAATAPKRARAPRKTAAKADAPAEGQAPAEGLAPAGEAAADAAPAPAPRKRTRKAVDAAADAAGAEASADVAPAGDEPPAPRAPRARARRSAAEEAAGEAAAPAVGSAPAPEAAPSAPTAVEPAMRAVADEAAAAADRAEPDRDGSEGGAGGDTPEAGEGGGEGRRSRSRRRRRGRRGGAGAGEGGADALQAEGDDGDIDGDGDGAEDVDGGAPDGEGAEGGESRGGRERPPRGDRPQRAIGPPVEFATADVSDTFADVLSGDFDTEPELVDGLPVIPAKRVLAAEPDAPKLHKVLAQSGIGSRRDMEQLITDGKVTVNGEVAHTGQRISFGDEVRVQGRVVKLRIAPPPARVIAYHKPAGEVVTMDDPEKRPTVFRRLPRLAHGKWQSVGRLDINTEGLLLFTNSGDLANKLMHPRFGVEREYAVRVLGTLDLESRDKLLSGVSIDGQPAQFKSIEDGGGEGANRWYRVVITEGRNREVRKLFDAVGMAVSRLIRIRYGSVVLPKGLKRGVWVDLDDNDVRRLRQLAGAEQGAREGGQQGPREGGPQQAQRDGQPPRGKGGPGRNERGPRGDRGPGQGQNAGGPQQGKNRNGRDRDRPRGGRQEQGSPAPVREPGDPSFIPNPLQQTFDRRAIQQRERPVVATHYDDEEDGPIGPIPNPLQQTYDKRGIQGNRDAFGGGKRKGGGGGGGGAPKQPDPLKTAVGYIGADAFVKKLNSRGGRGRR